MKSSIFLKNRNPYYWIAGVSLLIYLQTLFFGFIYLDDNVLILDNFRYLNDLSNTGKIFFQGAFNLPYTADTFYRPALILSLMLDIKVSGQLPIAYHLTNSLLHITSTILFFVLGQKLGYKKSWTLFFALFFAAHPVLSQTVAWIPARNDSLLTVFVLASLICFLNFLKTPNKKFLFWHLFFFLFGLFTKESAMGLIFLASFLTISKPKKILKIAPYWIGIIIIWATLRHFALINGLGIADHNIVPTILKNFFPVNLDFLGKIFFPFDLRVIADIESLNIWPGLATLVLITAGLYWTKKFNWRIVIFGALFFGGFLFPSIAFSDFLILDNRIYLPMIGILIILLEIFKNKEFNKICFYTGTGILLTFATMAFIQTRNFRNRIIFWEQAVIDAPNLALAHGNMGSMYLLDGRLDEAQVEYEKCLKLNPLERMIHNNLALIYKQRKQFNIAEQLFLQEIKINPKYDASYFNLANVYHETGKIQKAIEYWEKTLEKNPEYINAYKNLAGYYYKTKDMEKVTYYINELKKRGIKVPPLK